MPDSIRILVTGSRDWDGRSAWLAFKQAVLPRVHHGLPSRTTLVHGACPTGGDRMADELASRYGFRVERHPADWKNLGSRAGFVRNAHMVSLGADECLAFLNPCTKHPDQQPHPSHGADHCATLAEQAGIRTVRITDV